MTSSFSVDKTPGMFEMHKTDVHCKRILFGGSADNGYARLLIPCLGDEALRQRITLIEGPPFEKELAELQDHFAVVAFDDVFRKQKLQLRRRVSFHGVTPPSTPSPNYASAAARPPIMSTAPAAGPQSPIPDSPGGGPVLRNRLGQRIDSRLEFAADDFKRLKQQRLCNPFHILGTCPFFQRHGNCMHEHGPRLSERQIRAMRAIARMSPCQGPGGGLNCDDSACIYGHRCTWDGCTTPVGCRFPREMHNVDTNVVST